MYTVFLFTPLLGFPLLRSYKVNLLQECSHKNQDLPVYRCLRMKWRTKTSSPLWFWKTCKMHKPRWNSMQIRSRPNTNLTWDIGSSYNCVPRARCRWPYAKTSSFSLSLSSASMDWKSPISSIYSRSLWFFLCSMFPTSKRSSNLMYSPSPTFQLSTMMEP